VGAAGAALNHAVAMPAAAEEANDSAEIPTKCVVTKFNLNLKAQIQYLDFEGNQIFFMTLFFKNGLG
jgi:hypothetical protein